MGLTIEKPDLFDPGCCTIRVHPRNSNCFVRTGSERRLRGRYIYNSKTASNTRLGFSSVQQPRQVVTRRSGSGGAQFNYSCNFEMQGAVSAKRMHGHNAPRNDKLNRFPLGVVSSVTTTLLFWARGQPRTYGCEIALPFSPVHRPNTADARLPSSFTRWDFGAVINASSLPLSEIHYAGNLFEKRCFESYRPLFIVFVI